MAWIKSHSELLSHPKVKKAARTLDISVITLIGHLHALWWWALEYAPDGVIGAYDPEDIADAIQWEGDIQAFFDALLNCGARNCSGLLDKDENEDLTIHDWEEHCGKDYKKRKEDAERKRDYRKRQKNTNSPQAEQAPKQEDMPCDNLKQSDNIIQMPVGRNEDAVNADYDSCINSPMTSAGRPEDVMCTSSVRGEERKREEKKREKDPPPPSSVKTKSLARTGDKPPGMTIELLRSGWNEVMVPRGLPFAKDVTDRRRELFKALVRKTPAALTAEFWMAVFEKILQSNFMMGRVKPPEGQEPFICELYWLLERKGAIPKLLDDVYLKTFGELIEPVHDGPEFVPWEGGDDDEPAELAK